MGLRGTCANPIVPAFGDVAVDDTPVPVRSALLPDEWMIRLYDADLNLVHTAFSEAVKADLAVAPSLSSAGIEAALIARR